MVIGSLRRGINTLMQSRKMRVISDEQTVRDALPLAHCFKLSRSRTTNLFMPQTVILQKFLKNTI